MARLFTQFKIAPKSKNINRAVYGVTIPNTIAINWAGVCVTISESGTCLILKSGADLNEPRESKVDTFKRLTISPDGICGSQS